ncbi:MAG: exodeoxyribonuclease VII small subunit [Actinomycetaceae bacterium]|nr:exodeoxyribonuclease VII small subunit [Actinomycetaceae bacterium]
MTETSQGTVEVAGLSYEQARDELVAIVRKLETGSAPLEETLTLWERGEELARRCQQILTEAQQRLERATQVSETTE